VAAPANWSTQQLAEFLAAVSGFRDETSATHGAVERAAEALEAEVAAVLQVEEILTVVGFPRGQVPADTLAEIAAGRLDRVELPGLGSCDTLVATLDHLQDGRLLVARSGDDGFTTEEADLLRGMARVLALTVRLLQVLEEAERRAVEIAHLNGLMEERQRLLERLSKIQRSISTRAPLDQVLDTIIAGASDLLGDEVAALRLLDSDDPSFAVVAAATGVEPEILKRIRRSPIDRGIGGKALVEDRLVVVEEYDQEPDALPEFTARQLKTAMAAPVHENGVVVGSLIVGSYDPARTYSLTEQEVLQAFAEHASLALTDARTVDAMHQAYHDQLTGLPNRALFAERLEERLRQADQNHHTVAIMFMDLDRFKLVNDSFGHAAGDQLLVTVAQRLQTCLDEALVARFGGDEFAILVDQQDQVEAEAVRLAGHIQAVLGQPVRLAGGEVTMGASIGIATGRPGHDQADELLRNADIAMYQAKADETERCAVFEPSMRASVLARMALESDLEQAIDAQQFRLLFQPTINLVTEEISGLEALIRWQHPVRGMVPPDEFIPLAEETGLIVPIGSWVLRQACEQAGRWQDAHPSEPKLSMNVNLSSRQLAQPDIVDEVAAVLEASRLEPMSLVIEITETTLMHDTDASIAKLKALKALGVRLAVDDFGTGYSSLGYLRRFPFDILKLDKSFVDGVTLSPEDAALCQAVIRLGEALNLTVVAEGIETYEQAIELRRLGCDLGQGYSFAKPLAPEEASKLLRLPRAGERLPHPQPAARPTPSPFLRTADDIPSSVGD
jgi:diguanylate cyclase (GGDEF)-like protein